LRRCATAVDWESLPWFIGSSECTRVVDTVTRESTRWPYNARGSGREWNSIDKLGAWLREQGFWYWWTRNDLEPVGNAMADDEETQDLPSPAFVDPPFSPF
jgi:hypothetical protein